MGNILEPSVQICYHNDCTTKQIISKIAGPHYSIIHTLIHSFIHYLILPQSMSHNNITQHNMGNYESHPITDCGTVCDTHYTEKFTPPQEQVLTHNLNSPVDHLTSVLPECMGLNSDSVNGTGPTSLHASRAEGVEADVTDTDLRGRKSLAMTAFSPKKKRTTRAKPTKAPANSPVTPKKTNGDQKKKKKEKGKKSRIIPSFKAMSITNQMLAFKQSQEPIFRNFFGDNQPTMGASELRFKIVDWIQRPIGADPAKPIFSYFLDVGRPFFADASGSIPGEQYTRAKIRKVKVWMLSPDSPWSFDSPPQFVQNYLTQVLTAVPVKDSQPQDALSLIGQGNTIIHPDVRQPWVQVGNWNWETMFENSQYEPYECPKSTNVPLARDLTCLFNLLLVDASNGKPYPNTGDGSVVFKVEIEVQAPIPLIPTPLRSTTETAEFTSVPAPTDYTQDVTPVQYILEG